jgi:transcriptional regulator with XRE-family HTH domain
MSMPITKLKEIREKQFLNMAELGALSKVSTATISRAESGMRIHLGSIKRLAKALGCKPEQLL